MTYKERLNRHLEYDWLKYLIIIICSIAIWMFAYNMANKPKDHERLDIFFLTASLYAEQEAAYNEAIDKALKAVNDSVILSVNFEKQSPTSDQIASLMTVRSLSTDIMIISDEYMQGHSSAFIEITPQLIEEYGWQELSFFVDEAEKRTAIEITDFAKLKDLFTQISYEKTNYDNEIVTYTKYYLGFPTSSTNIGSFSSEKKHNNDNKQAFIAVNEFVKLFK